MSVPAGAPDVGASCPLPEPVEVPTLTEDRYQRLAWAVIAGGFVAFCLLLGGGLWAGFNYYVAQPNDPHKATVQRAHGSKLEVRHAGQKTAAPVTDRTDLVEGDTVQTDAGTDALITLFDRSTIQLSYNSSLTLQRMRSSRFQTHAKYFKLALNSGQIRIASYVKEPYDEMKMLVNTADDTVSVSLDPDSVAVVNVADPPVAGVRLTASTAGGTIYVKGSGPWQEVSTGAMVRVPVAGGAAAVVPAANELIANGNFKQPSENPNSVAAGWRTIFTPAPPSTAPVVITVSQQASGAPVPFVRLKRDPPAAGPPKDAVEVRLRQEINQPVSYYQKLDCTLRAQIIDQDQIPVGPGIYPLTVRVTYEDADGKEGFWNHSFYAQSLVQTFPTGSAATALERGDWSPDGVLDAQYRWDLMQQSPRPARITAVELIVTGYSFNVSATNISLNAH
ncbi:MAG: hypothetical protein M3Z04_03890 [Chloroflexota bacterium]|nr:hypothetical protein [Chloroflexota bacterium]